MGRFAIFALLGLVTAVLFGWWKCQPADPPKLKDGWWGKGDPSKYKEDTTINKFTINIPQEKLEDLKKRLDLTIYPEKLEDSVGFQYGFSPNYLKEVVEYWKTKYDWRKQEARLNQWPHYKTQIDGIRVHFIHAKPKEVPQGVQVYPLMIIHGWPGSVVEFLDILPLLTTPRPGVPFVFEVIAPSIPGYGFSEASHKMGFGAVEAAQLFDKLMKRLKFSKYLVQGGDWGALISTNMGALYPDSVLGLHTNFGLPLLHNPWFWVKLTVGNYLPWLVVDSKDYDKIYPLGQVLGSFFKEMGYNLLQSTKPDTVGTALLNSPAGLAAYILEKFSTWTNPEFINATDGAITKKYKMDDLLTNVMIYWVTGTITSSVRLYKESFSPRQLEYKMDNVVVKVPTGIANFPNELLSFPKSLVQDKYLNLVRFSEFTDGGHFAAMEEPKKLADDIFGFVKKLN